MACILQGGGECGASSAKGEGGRHERAVQAERARVGGPAQHAPRSPPPGGDEPAGWVRCYIHIIPSLNNIFFAQLVTSFSLSDICGYTLYI